MAYKIVHVFLLIAGTTFGFVLSVNQSWMKAMNTCAHHNQAPFDPGKAYTSEKQWMGTAKYKTSCGVVTLQIEETEDQQYCFAFILSLLYDTSLWNGAECIPPLTGLLSGINGHKCILTDFNEVSIKSLPSPSNCLVNKENSSQYVSCEEKLEDGCQRIDNTSRLVITVSFTDRSSGYCKNESSKADPEECSLTAYIKEYKYYIIGFGGLVVIIHLACICCCVRCQTTRQPLTREKDRVQEPVLRPNSEHIERIHINRDLSSQNTTYEVVTNKTQKADASMRNVQQTMQDNDMAVSRSANGHYGDYDLAWPGTSWSTTVTSPDVDYAHEEMMNKQTMDTVPEEEIYSKQKLVWEDGNDAIKQSFLDVQKKIKYSNVAENNHKKVTTGGMKRVEITDSNTFLEASYSTIVILDQNQDVQKAGFNKADDNIYSKVNINGTKQLNKDEETQGNSEKPLESIKSIGNSSCMNKPPAGNDNGKLAMIKKTQDKIPPTTSKGNTNVNNLDIGFKTDKTNTMTDENAAVLMANVRFETKL